MNIVLVGGQDIPGIGGAESYMINLAKALTKNKHNVTIICCGREAKEFTSDDVHIKHYVCPKSNLIAQPLLFFKSLGYIIKNRKSIDVVNFQSIFLAFIPAFFVWLSGCKTYYTIHSLAEDNPKHGKLMKFIIRIVAHISFLFAGRNIITISKSKAKEIKKRYGKKAFVLPCGVNIEEIKEESDILQRFGIKEGQYYLTIGRIDPIKNLDILIKSIFAKKVNNYQLVIAGDYNNQHGEYLKTLAGDNENIIFTGPVMGADKETLLKNSFACCLVSSSEGMPISLLEAMSYGKRCIVTKIPAIQEILDEQWGYWCEVGDEVSTCEQMEILERENINEETEKKMISYIKENHQWNEIAKKYSVLTSK